MFEKYTRNQIGLCGLIGSVFFYFLVFPQFALIHRIAESGLHIHADKVAMTLMGLAGIGGSLYAGRPHDRSFVYYLLQAALVMCAVAALMVSFDAQMWVFYAASILAGFGLGLATVSIVSLLRPLLAGGMVGLIGGLGTGLAYFFANVPYLFESIPSVQCYVSGLAVLAGLPALWLVRFPEDRSEPFLASDDHYQQRKYKFLVTLVLPFMALVWLDSMAFTLIQKTPALYHVSWGTPHMLWQNGWGHLIAGVLAGLMLDRGFMHRTVAFSAIALCLGYLGIKAGGHLSGIGHLMYVGGVSLYSTVLVVGAAIVPVSNCKVLPARRAAILYCCAGWVASGAGVVAGLSAIRLPWYVMMFVLVYILGALLFAETLNTFKSG